MENTKFIKIDTLYTNSTRNIIHRRGTDKIEYITEFLVKIGNFIDIYNRNTDRKNIYRHKKKSAQHIIHRRRTGKIEYITEFLVKNTSIHSKHTAVINRFIDITEILYKRYTGTFFRHKINKNNGINATYSGKLILYTMF